MPKLNVFCDYSIREYSLEDNNGNLVKWFGSDDFVVDVSDEFLQRYNRIKEEYDTLQSELSAMHHECTKKNADKRQLVNDIKAADSRKKIKAILLKQGWVSAGEGYVIKDERCLMLHEALDEIKRSLLGFNKERTYDDEI